MEYAETTLPVITQCEGSCTSSATNVTYGFWNVDVWFFLSLYILSKYVLSRTFGLCFYLFCKR